MSAGMMEDVRGVRWTGNPECKTCDGLFWIDVFEMKDGQKINKIENLIELYSNHPDGYQSQVKRRYTRVCPSCREDQRLRSIDQEIENKK